MSLSVFASAARRDAIGVPSSAAAAPLPRRSGILRAAPRVTRSREPARCCASVARAARREREELVALVWRP